LAVGYWLLAVGYWLLAVGYWLLAVGYWLLAVGCWLLAIGYWLLAVGCWLLAIGCCLLPMHACSPCSGPSVHPQIIVFCSRRRRHEAGELHAGDGAGTMALRFCFFNGVPIGTLSHL
jgi:hypothetical protein